MLKAETQRAGSPDLSIIICTRDRGASLLPTVESVLADAPADGSAEVLVIDQGQSDAVEQALALLLLEDSRLRYHRDHPMGLSAARNAGLRLARGLLIAFTDDDCSVEPGWVAALTAAFAAHPEAGVIFGHVACAEHDPTQGYLPGFQAREGLLTRRRMFAGAGHWGMGANMALRRSTSARVGPFDELLGAGAPLKSAEDVDYVLRATRRGIGVYHCAAARVVHYGFRPWSSASSLMKGAGLGIGAMYAKQVRAGHLFAALLLLSELGGRAWDVLRNALRGQRPLGANTLLYELKGFWRGLWLPLDRRQQPLALLFEGGAAYEPGS
jgi:glycosyltransferase involved in cell wall biosynthesis